MGAPMSTWNWHEVSLRPGKRQGCGKRQWVWGPGLLLGASLLALGCASAGPFGHAQLYTPLDVEESATQGSVPFDPSAARRKPETWKGRRVAAFGVITDIAKSNDAGTQRVLLSMRGLQPRNLCDGPDDETCRVTVTEKEFAQLWAVIPEGKVVPVRTPKDRLQPGSLLRVVGNLEPAPNDTDPPTVNADFARHWPLQMYVTTSARQSMRR